MKDLGKAFAGLGLGGMVGFMLHGDSTQEAILCAILLILSLILVSINEEK